jgi:hypothetical protein
MINYADNSYNYHDSYKPQTQFTDARMEVDAPAGGLMFNKEFFERLQDRLWNYFHRFPSADSAVVLIHTSEAEYLLVDVVEADDRFITFAHWPREVADLPKRWSDVTDSLAAVTIPYEEIRSVHFDPRLARGREIGFTKSGRKLVS